jgi:hypothetical protein
MMLLQQQHAAVGAALKAGVHGTTGQVSRCCKPCSIGLINDSEFDTVHSQDQCYSYGNAVVRYVQWSLLRLFCSVS